MDPVTLLAFASRYYKMGYMVGLTLGKVMVEQYSRYSKPSNKFDGISIVLHGLVCVDFDTPLHFDVGWGRELPHTWKEKSPHGHHLFYSLGDVSRDLYSQIKWKPEVDLLVRDTDMSEYSRYGKTTTTSIDRHVLVSPTPGYVRLWPEEIPKIEDLPIAPAWLIKEVT